MMNVGKLLEGGRSLLKSVSGKGSSVARGEAVRARRTATKFAAARASTNTAKFTGGASRPEIIPLAQRAANAKAFKAGANPSRIKGRMKGALMPGGAAGTAAIAVGVGVPSFFSGVGSAGISDSVYDLALGDPNFDEYALGRKMNMRQLMAPFPGERIAQGGAYGAVGRAGPGMVSGGAVGGGTGVFAGALAGLKLKGGRGALIGAGVGGLGGTLAGGAMGAKALPGRTSSDALLTRQTFQDAWRANRKNRNQVDGSMAFGMYNARLG